MAIYYLFVVLNNLFLLFEDSTSEFFIIFVFIYFTIKLILKLIFYVG